MVLFSWVLSFVLSSPQAMLFRKMKHPDMEFYQCTTKMVIENISTVVMDGDKAKYYFFGIESDIVYKIYHLSFLVFVYFLPLCCLLVSYIFIIHFIRRRCQNKQFRKISKMTVFQAKCSASSQP